MVTENKPREQSLDFIRGIAIALVFLNHIENWVAPEVETLNGALGWAYWKVKTFGSSGVDLFFILSGFLISGLLFKELRQSGTINLKRFWLRRGMKIWPSYFFLLILLAIFGTTSWLDMSSSTSFLKSILIHSLFLQNYTANPNGPTWSLAVEEHFYIFIPILLFLLARVSPIESPKFKKTLAQTASFIVLSCLALRVVHYSPQMDPDSYQLTHLRIDALMLGVLLRFLVETKSKLIDLIQTNRPLASLIALALVSPAAFYSRSNQFLFTAGFTLLPIGYAILVILIYGGGPGLLPNNLPVRTVSFLGVHSYNIYLWHWFVPKFSPFGFETVSTFLFSGLQGASSVIARGVLFIAISVIFGILVTKLVEEPFLKMRNRWVP